MYYSLVIMSPSAHFINSSYNEPTELLVEDRYDEFRLVPTTENFCDLEPDEVPEVVTREHARDGMITYTDYYKDKYNNITTIDWNGHNFYYDINAIQSTYNMCMDLTDTDNIPTSGGKWKTTETDSNGYPVYVVFTVGEFKDFTEYCYNIKKDNFFNREYHIDKIVSLYNDSNNDIYDIFNYDTSTGWTIV
jgi:hypothetical protein